MTALTIFQRMRETNYNDIFQPARELFHEVGSYGSAGALRVPPMVLFYANDLNETMEVNNMFYSLCLIIETQQYTLSVRKMPVLFN